MHQDKDDFLKRLLRMAPAIASLMEREEEEMEEATKVTQTATAVMILAL